MRSEAPQTDEGWGAVPVLMKLQSKPSVLPCPHQSRLRRASFPQGKPFGYAKVDLLTDGTILPLYFKIRKAQYTNAILFLQQLCALSVVAHLCRFIMTGSIAFDCQARTVRIKIHNIR